ncbi:MAG: T9SS type A sorting domain-containing protein, partial [Paludibacteraceae bacterium]|nr:T9SS type A sorting domain-containing protein [Paludibacteraceae bacterium]
DISVTQSFIDKQYASGGGDYPEAVPEALMAALNSAGWNEDARARIAFLILDAPCHQDSATLALLHEQILNAAALGVRIVPVVCSGIAESGEFLLRAMALVTNGTSFFLTDDSGIGNPHLKPTTDSLKVEHLNDMLVRTIVEFSYMPVCEPSEVSVQESEVEELFIPNPFDQKDLEADPTIPHGEGIHYIVDITGKLLTVYEGDISSLNSQLSTFNLPIGVYFIKTFYNGQWFTKKIFVR